jgi:hypothetical protein
LKRECPEWKKRKAEFNKGKGHNNRPQDDQSDGYDSGDVLVATSSGSKNDWIMDSGCSYHMTPHKEFFSSFTEKDIGSVMLGDYRPCEILGIGTVTLKLSNGTVTDLSQVRYIPKLKRNLISLGTLEDRGYAVSLKDGKSKVIRGSLVVLTGLRRNSHIYILEGEAICERDNSLNVQGEQSTSMLWHKRMGHISEQGMVELKKQEVLGDLKSTSTGFYEYSVLGKAHRVKFTRSKHQTQGILDYVHADLRGPART